MHILKQRLRMERSGCSLRTTIRGRLKRTWTHTIIKNILGAGQKITLHGDEREERISVTDPKKIGLKGFVGCGSVVAALVVLMVVVVVVRY